MKWGLVLSDVFTRTDEGLANEHLFYGVDVILYCEGDETEDGTSYDEVFWREMLAVHGLMVASKGVGNKRHVLAMADKVINQDIANVIVAVDADYSRFLGGLPSDRRVLQTYGYSWESDIICGMDPNDVLPAFGNVGASVNPAEEFKKFLDEKALLLRRLTALDIKYIASEEPLFDRKKPQSILQITKGAEPEVAIARILQRAVKIGRCQSAVLPAKVYNGIDGARCFFGKTVAKLVYYWMGFRAGSSNSIPYEPFLRIAMVSTVRNLGAPIHRHYASMVARVR